jgi:acyl carrier protein
MKFKAQILDGLQAIHIGISELKDEDIFGDTLGMDSQEIAEFKFSLEKKLHIKLPEGFFRRQMSISEASVKLNEYISHLVAEPA